MKRLIWTGKPALGAALAATQFAVAAAELPLWEVGVGAAALHLPHYRGSSQSRNWLLPLPYAVYRGEMLRADREGARAVLVDSDRLDVDFSITASAPTPSRDNLARVGMPDLPPTVEVGPNLNLRLGESGRWRWDLRMPVRAAITVQSKPRAIGWSITPMIYGDGRYGAWEVGVRAGPLWASRGLNAHTYDVSPAQANSSRPAYSSAAGFAGWQATAGVSRRFERLWIGAYMRFDSVRGAVFEASPLVRRSSNLSFGLGLSWVFSQSDQKVPDRDARP